MKPDLDTQLALLCEGTAEVTPLALLEQKLQRNKKLIIKLGCDPTAPDLHLGHVVVLQKLKDFQQLGHEIVFLIGDFTAQIGDPSGRSKTRPPLSAQEIMHNAQTYFEQVSRVLDPSTVTVKYNAEWLSKFSFEDALRLAGKVTLARILERDDFQKRLAEHAPIGFHELFYPLMQGYDSVALQADVEVGGTDQTFNLLMGRVLQEQYDQEPQVIMTMPILEGLDGVQKMSKSLGNYVGLSDTPEDAFGKLMSVSDELMWKYFSLVLRTPQAEVDAMKQHVAAGSVHPMELKKEMAYNIVAAYWSDEGARRGQERFEALFQQHDYSKATPVNLPKGFANPVWIVDLLRACNAVSSSSEAKRLITSGAVELDGTVIRDFNAQVSWKPDMILRVGKKRFYRLG